MHIARCDMLLSLPPYVNASVTGLQCNLCVSPIYSPAAMIYAYDIYN